MVTFKLGAGGTKGQSWGPGYQVVDTRAFSLKRRCDALIHRLALPPFPSHSAYIRGIETLASLREGETEARKASGYVAGPKACTHGTVPPPAGPRQLSCSEHGPFWKVHLPPGIQSLNLQRGEGWENGLKLVGDKLSGATMALTSCHQGLHSYAAP